MLLQKVILMILRFVLWSALTSVKLSAIFKIVSDQHAKITYSFCSNCLGNHREFAHSCFYSKWHHQLLHIISSYELSNLRDLWIFVLIFTWSLFTLILFVNCSVFSKLLFNEVSRAGTSSIIRFRIIECIVVRPEKDGLFRLRHNK